MNYKTTIIAITFQISVDIFRMFNNYEHRLYLYEVVHCRNGKPRYAKNNQYKEFYHEDVLVDLKTGWILRLLSNEVQPHNSLEYV